MEHTDLLICQCQSPEHQIMFLWDDDENPAVYMEIHLNKLPFFKRLKYAIKYIFGYKCKYGAFDEVILKPEDAYKVKDILTYLEHGRKEDTRI